MIRVKNVNISDNTIKLFKRLEKFNDQDYNKKMLTKDPEWKSSLIKDIIGSLCIDNGIEGLERDHIILDTSIDGNGEWNEEDKTLKLYFNTDMTMTAELTRTILHEFRHIWQHMHSEFFDEVMQKNLGSSFDISYIEYLIQPVEVDTDNFALATLRELNAIFKDKDIEEVMKRESSELELGRSYRIHVLKTQGYVANDKYFSKLLDFRSDVLHISIG